MNSHLTVLVRYKTQSGKAEMALQAIRELIEKVKEEPFYQSITIYTNAPSGEEILLSEEWSDSHYYQGEHMLTEHLQQFIRSSREFLAGPPDITFWQKV